MIFEATIDQNLKLDLGKGIHILYLILFCICGLHILVFCIFCIYLHSVFPPYDFFISRLCRLRSSHCYFSYAYFAIFICSLSLVLGLVFYLFSLVPSPSAPLVDTQHTYQLHGQACGWAHSC